VFLARNLKGTPKHNVTPAPEPGSTMPV